ncbi:hypothetical protein M427DRAFT_133838 [Gonapodya prolifera JEL478]|uniref:Uncharacterized protein n=1 Tax=Gonapodya prolifera (strain JEL478) TaxID=1344416 RepID=A0A139AIV9_GONPJ|nr:hypothetical protein M427DRAFT_133838 [Gonapodya prolifera JEL478]|eukprot:KXS16751.1 hypothetical protein M427DRAFT_133838 [Gonapodya prolifera JEL478]
MALSGVDDDVFLLLNRDAGLTNHTGSANDGDLNGTPNSRDGLSAGPSDPTRGVGVGVDVGGNVDSDSSALDGLLFAKSLGLFNPPAGTADQTHHSQPVLPRTSASSAAAATNFSAASLPLLATSALPLQSSAVTAPASFPSFPSLTTSFNLKELIDIEVQRQRIELRRAQVEVESVELDVQRKRMEVERDRLTLERDRLDFAEARLKLQREYNVVLDDAVHVPSSSADLTNRKAARQSAHQPKTITGGPARSPAPQQERLGGPSRRNSGSRSPVHGVSHEDAVPDGNGPSGALSQSRTNTHLNSTSNSRASPPANSSSARNRLLSELSSSAGFVENLSRSTRSQDRKLPPSASITGKSKEASKSEGRTASRSSTAKAGKDDDGGEGRTSRSGVKKEAEQLTRPQDCPVPIAERDLWTKVIIDLHGGRLKDSLISSQGSKTPLHSQAMQYMQAYLRAIYPTSWQTFKEPGRGWLVPLSRADDLDRYLAEFVGGWPQRKERDRKAKEKERESESEKSKAKERERQSDPREKDTGQGTSKRNRPSIEEDEMEIEDDNASGRAGKKRRTTDGDETPAKGTSDDGRRESTGPKPSDLPSNPPTPPLSSTPSKRSPPPHASEDRYPWLELFRQRYGDMRWDTFYKSTSRNEQDNIRDQIKAFLTERHGAKNVHKSQQRYLMVPLDDGDALDQHLRQKAKRWIKSVEDEGGDGAESGDRTGSGNGNGVAHTDTDSKMEDVVPGDQSREKGRDEEVPNGGANGEVEVDGMDKASELDSGDKDGTPSRDEDSSSSSSSGAPAVADDLSSDTD